MRQVHRRARLDRHVDVRDRALQRQHRRESVDVRRELRGEVEVHEPEVVVAVRGLCGAAGVDDVRIRHDLVVRAEPRHRDEIDDIVRVVVDKRVGIGDGQLLQRAPQPVVAARFGEVVSGLHAARLLLLDQRCDHGSRAVDDGRVEGAGEDRDAGAVHQGAGQLRLHRAAALRRRDVVGQRFAVEQHSALDAVRMRVVGRVGLHLDDGSEVVEPAVVAGEPAAVRTDGRCGHGRTPSSWGSSRLARERPSVNPCRSLNNPSG